MRLSRLHIAGFKSFPDRAELGFDHGVTAIVGPNGCGKSNVVDAITWVLGEQSAKSLRGERMEDVIFNGSDARKPTAAAEVRLKFSEVAAVAAAMQTRAGGESGGVDAAVDGVDAAAADSDALLDDPVITTRDVEIGRRLYRSGESEYLIDGEVCRLRDVHDLLMDSGLGVKAYAVIEQGKIGQILSSRPHERRMLIEEAAGVTKYKSRRRAAELKLEAAEQNLTRVDDIIFELDKQRAALKRQAARARRYKRLRDELRTWERVQFARRYEALSADIDAASARLADARERETAASAHVAELEAVLETIRLGLTEAEAHAAGTREAAHARELEIGRRQQTIQFERQQIDDLARQAETLAAEVRDLEARRGPAAERLAAEREAERHAREALAEAGHQVALRETDYSRALAGVQAVEQDADATRAAVLAATTTISALRQARDHAAAARDRVAAELERFEREAQDLAAEAGRLDDQHRAAAAALADARAAHAQAVTDRHEADQALAARRADRERLAEALGARQRDLAARDARLRSLQELDASRVTFGDAARFLLAETGAGIQQHGAVADHLRVERSYERAVDALMGDLLQHVIVDSHDDLTRGFERLAEENAGRCGFVVLGDAAPEAEAAAPLVVPPGTRALADVVRAVGPHAAALARLVGRALIAETRDQARAVSRTVPVPVATMAGEVFRGAWLVQGGSRQDVRGILETRAEVAALGEEVTAATADIAALSARVAALDGDIAEGVRTLASRVDDLHAREKAIVGLEGQAARTADEQARVGRRLEVVATERTRAHDERAAAEHRRDEALAAIDAHEARQREAEANLNAVSAQLQAAREEAEARLRLVTTSRADQAGLVERAAALASEIERLEEAGRELEARLTGRAADIARTETRRADLRQSIADGERQLDRDVADLDRLRQAVREHDERVVSLRADFTVRDQAIRGARHALEAVRADVMQFEVARARAQADLAHLSDACLEAVGAPLDEVVAIVARMTEAGELNAPAAAAASAVAAEDDEMEGEGAAAGETQPAEASQAVSAGEGAAQADANGAAATAGAPADAASGPVNPEAIIAVLRGKIDKLGPVNMMAIEQFDELESRHTFLTTQRKDLLDSIAQTGEAIRKIDKTTRERFAEAFESINRHFERTFTTLFGGGRAGLVLIDHENEEESGVDIIAQPPGKRLQNVQLLSGGEKALTAMALMFSVFKHRPSPFCLLDEIDAPLDDANIGRFIEMLQGMQEHTQFILITHNRKTMEIANRLYGVTMEEPGVSKLISLQFN